MKYPPHCLGMVSLIMLLQALSMSQAWAHRMHVFPRFEGQTVSITVSFGRNAPAVGAKIEVHDSDGNLLHQGRSDQRGQFQFPVRRAKELTIVADDGAGHRSTLTISRERLLAAGITSSDRVNDGQPPIASDTDYSLEQRLNALSQRVAQLEDQQQQPSEAWRYATGILLLLATTLAALLWQRWRR